MSMMYRPSAFGAGETPPVVPYSPPPPQPGMTTEGCEYGQRRYAGMGPCVPEAKDESSCQSSGGVWSPRCCPDWGHAGGSCLPATQHAEVCETTGLSCFKQQFKSFSISHRGYYMLGAPVLGVAAAMLYRHRSHRPSVGASVAIGVGAAAAVLGSWWLVTGITPMCMVLPCGGPG